MVDNSLSHRVDNPIHPDVADSRVAGVPCIGIHRDGHECSIAIEVMEG